MTHPILSRIPVLNKFVDERFLEHRRRSSSTAGFITLFAVIALFEYRLIRYGVWSWDLVAIVGVFAVVKVGLFAWYRFND